jgi:hypothetical protein
MSSRYEYERYEYRRSPEENARCREWVRQHRAEVEQYCALDLEDPLVIEAVRVGVGRSALPALRWARDVREMRVAIREMQCKLHHAEWDRYTLRLVRLCEALGGQTPDAEHVTERLQRRGRCEVAVQEAKRERKNRRWHFDGGRWDNRRILAALCRQRGLPAVVAYRARSLHGECAEQQAENHKYVVRQFGRKRIGPATRVSICMNVPGLTGTREFWSGKEYLGVHLVLSEGTPQEVRVLGKMAFARDGRVYEFRENHSWSYGGKAATTWLEVTDCVREGKRGQLRLGGAALPSWAAAWVRDARREQAPVSGRQEVANA